MKNRCIKKAIIITSFVILFTACSKTEVASEEEITQVEEVTQADDVMQEPLLLADIDGNEYKTVAIGEQVWMAENLKVTNFNDGTAIHLYSFEAGDDWSTFNRPKAVYQWGDTSDLSNLHNDELPKDYYGAMYNHFAIESGKLAPEGWRIPTIEDFKKLEAYLTANGHQGAEATALKSKTGWSTSSGNGTDNYGFNGLPGGYVHTQGGATGAPVIGVWATSDVNIERKLRQMISLHNTSILSVNENSLHLGAAIRCIKN